MHIHPLLRRSAVLLAVIAAAFLASTVVAAGSAPLAQEQYYSSYSDPRAAGPAQPSDASDGTAWLPIALAAAAGLLVGGVTATHRPRRSRAPRPVA